MFLLHEQNSFRSFNMLSKQYNVCDSEKIIPALEKIFCLVGNFGYYLLYNDLFFSRRFISHIIC